MQNRTIAIEYKIKTPRISYEELQGVHYDLKIFKLPTAAKTWMIY